MSGTGHARSRSWSSRTATDRRRSCSAASTATSPRARSPRSTSRGSATGAGLGPRHHRALRLPGGVARLHPLLALGRQHEPLLPGLSEGDGGRAARRLPHERAVPALRARRRHPLGRPHVALPALVGDALGGRTRAAPADGRRDVRLERGLVLRLRLHLRQRACSSRKPGAKARSWSAPRWAAAATSRPTSTG